MNCTRCGAVLPNGANVCPNCGTPVQMGQPMMNQQPMGQPMMNQQMGYQQPMGQPMMNQQMGYQQPMGQPMMNQQMGYQQPMGQPMMNQQMGYRPMGQSMNGGGIGAYFGSLSKNVMALIRMIAALVLLIAPLIPWATAKAKVWGETVKESANLFKIGGIEILFAILIMLTAVIIILWDMADYVPALGKIKAKVAGVPYIEIVIVGIALVFVLLATILAVSKDDKEEMEWFGGKIYRSIGCWMAWIAVVGAAVPSFLNMGNKRQ